MFAAFLIRMMLFSEARLCFQALDDKHLFGNTDLALLEHPWGPESTPGDLLARMEQDAGLAGNAYIWAPPGEDRLVRLRPGLDDDRQRAGPVDGGGQYRRKIGYWIEPPKGVTDQGEGQFYPADEVCHWAPIPDPCADFRGMSWLTPVVRDIAGDDGLTQYKIKYLQNSASPNLLIKYAAKLQDGTVDKIRERMAARHGGVDNAFKTLVLDQGADVTVIGNSPGADGLLQRGRGGHGADPGRVDGPGRAGRPGAAARRGQGLPGVDAQARGPVGPPAVAVGVRGAVPAA